MKPELNIFGIKIYSYHLMIIISLILMIIVNVVRAKKYGYKILFGVVTAILVNVFAILGAFLMYKLEMLPYKEKGNGLSFYGTVFFLPIFMFIIGKIFKKNIKDYSDYWSLTVPMELAIVRIGCYLAGCCYGITTKYGVHFPFDPEGVNRVPVQLIEMVLDFIVFGLLIINEKNKKNKGLGYPIFMMFYGIIRFIIECFRTNPKIILGLSNAHIFSIISFIVGIIFIIKILFNHNQKESE